MSLMASSRSTSNAIAPTMSAEVLGKPSVDHLDELSMQRINARKTILHVQSTDNAA